MNVQAELHLVLRPRLVLAYTTEPVKVHND